MLHPDNERQEGSEWRQCLPQRAGFDCLLVHVETFGTLFRILNNRYGYGWHIVVGI